MRTPIELIKNRSDIGAGTRGADIGIDAMEIAAINQGSDFFRRFPSVDVPTRNEAVYEPDTTPYAKHIVHIYQQCKQLALIVEDTLIRQHFPLVLSGDHSSSIGTISGLKAHFTEERLGVVWIDAHADIHSPYTTPSGNVHGMPLAALMQEDNRQAEQNQVDEETETYWKKLQQISFDSPKLAPEHLIYFGVRDYEEPEQQVMERLGIRNFSVSEVRERGVQSCLDETLEKLSACEVVYISLDVDSLDSEKISTGTGTPVPSGFYPKEVTELIKGLLASRKVVCLEVVEVNPLLDNQGNKMAEVAFQILEEAVGVLEGW